MASCDRLPAFLPPVTWKFWNPSWLDFIWCKNPSNEQVLEAINLKSIPFKNLYEAPKRGVSREGMLCPLPYSVAGGVPAISYDTIKQEVTRQQSDKCRSSIEHSRCHAYLSKQCHLLRPSPEQHDMKKNWKGDVTIHTQYTICTENLEQSTKNYQNACISLRLQSKMSNIPRDFYTPRTKRK